MNELVVKDKRSATAETAVSLSPMQELQMQIVKTGDLEKLKELRGIEKEWREDQAKQAFNVAFAAFKGEAVRLLRTRAITDGPLKGKKHAELGVIVSTVTPALSKHGLSISWKLTKDEKEWMEVSCTLRHIEGHSESVTMGGAPDSGPGRNAIQARGSAKTYLERYTCTAILGLAPEDADNDGAGDPTITQDEGARWVEKIGNASTVEATMAAWTEAVNAAKHLTPIDYKAMTIFTEARDERLKTLRRAK